MEVLKGYLIKTSEGGKRAQIKSMTGEIIDDVLMLYPYGFTSNMQTEEEEGSMVLLLKVMGSKTNIFGIPYNPILQPSLEETEVALGNFKKGNKITFKANGDVEVITEQNVNINCAEINQTATGAVNIIGSTIDLADAIGLVLNDSASMTVDTTTSNPVQPVVIVSAGQTKVSA